MTLSVLMRWKSRAGMSKNISVNLIEEIGRVVALDAEYVLIETQPRSSCGSCRMGDSCGTSALDGFFSERSSQVRLLNHLNLHVGDKAVIGINESVLLSTAAMAYILPLLLMIMVALIFSETGVADGISFIFSLLSLFIGMVISNRIMKRENFNSAEIILLRDATESI